MKEKSWIEHLISLPKREVGVLSNVCALSLNHDERPPTYGYSDSMTSNSLAGLTIMYNKAASLSLIPRPSSDFHSLQYRKAIFLFAHGESLGTKHQPAL